MNKKILQRFSHTIGHDLKQPLGLIRAYSYYICKKLTSEHKDIASYTDKIDEQVDILTTMLSSIAEYAVLSSTSSSPHSSIVNLTNCITTAIHKINKIYPSNSITFKHAHDIHLKGVEPQLEEVFFHILDNACKASTKQKRITISVNTSPSSATVMVTDRGIGIDPSERARVFEPFYRTTSSKKAGWKGTGLGLTIAQELIKLHKGSIAIDCTDHTTTVTVTIPFTV